MYVYVRSPEDVSSVIFLDDVSKQNQVNFFGMSVDHQVLCHNM